MKTKTETQPNIVSAIASAVVEITEHTDTTESYEKKLDDIKGTSECTIRVDSLELGEGYKSLSVSSCKETVSYSSVGVSTVSYRTLTHRLDGKAVSFGISCTPKGKIELYQFLSAPGTAHHVDCVKLAELKISKHVVDPMYAFVSAEKLYIVYNVPSPAALDAIATLRAPEVDENGACASGYPGIACFNLKTDEQDCLLTPFASMSQYACGLYFDTTDNQPKLAVANIYVTKEKPARPSIAGLVKSLLDDDSPMKAPDFPLGVSSVSFVEKSEIVQAPMDGDPENGICSIILDNSNEVDAYLFSIEEKDVPSGDSE